MKPLDPLDLTRRLVNIESITYNEGAVGEYLDSFLREVLAGHPNSRERRNCVLGKMNIVEVAGLRPFAAAAASGAPATEAPSF